MDRVIDITKTLPLHQKLALFVIVSKNMKETTQMQCIWTTKSSVASQNVGRLEIIAKPHLVV